MRIKERANGRYDHISFHPDRMIATGKLRDVPTRPREVLASGFEKRRNRYLYACQVHFVRRTEISHFAGM